MTRRLKDGKTKAETIRCLKRYIATTTTSLNPPLDIYRSIPTLASHAGEETRPSVLN